MSANWLLTQWGNTAKVFFAIVANDNWHICFFLAIIFQFKIFTDWLLFYYHSWTKQNTSSSKLTFRLIMAPISLFFFLLCLTAHLKRNSRYQSRYHFTWLRKDDQVSHTALYVTKTVITCPRKHSQEEKTPNTLKTLILSGTAKRYSKPVPAVLLGATPSTGIFSQISITSEANRSRHSKWNYESRQCLLCVRYTRRSMIGLLIQQMNRSEDISYPSTFAAKKWNRCLWSQWSHTVRREQCLELSRKWEPAHSNQSKLHNGVM